MKKSRFKWITAVLGVSALLCLPMWGSAETSGYWTMETDEEGRQVMIYTYTSLDEITYEPVEGMSPSDEEELPSGNPAEISAGSVNASLKNQSPLEDLGVASTQPVHSLAVMGILSLAGLGAILYKII